MVYTGNYKIPKTGICNNPKKSSTYFFSPQKTEQLNFISVKTQAVKRPLANFLSCKIFFSDFLKQLNSFPRFFCLGEIPFPSFLSSRVFSATKIEEVKILGEKNRDHKKYHLKNSRLIKSMIPVFPRSYKVCSQKNRDNKKYGPGFFGLSKNTSAKNWVNTKCEKNLCLWAKVRGNFLALVFFHFAFFSPTPHTNISSYEYFFKYHGYGR